MNRKAILLMAVSLVLLTDYLFNQRVPIISILDLILAWAAGTLAICQWMKGRSTQDEEK